MRVEHYTIEHLPHEGYMLDIFVVDLSDDEDAPWVHHVTVWGPYEGVDALVLPGLAGWSHEQVVKVAVEQYLARHNEGEGVAS